MITLKTQTSVSRGGWKHYAQIIHITVLHKPCQTAYIVDKTI